MAELLGQHSGSAGARQTVKHKTREPQGRLQLLVLQQPCLIKKCHHFILTLFESQKNLKLCKFWAVVSHWLQTFFLLWIHCGVRTSLDFMRICCRSKQCPLLSSIFWWFIGIKVKLRHWNKSSGPHFLSQVLSKAADPNHRQPVLLEKGVCSDPHRTAQQFQSKSLETISAMILNW